MACPAGQVVKRTCPATSFLAPVDTIFILPFAMREPKFRFRDCRMMKLAAVIPKLLQPVLVSPYSGRSYSRSGAITVAAVLLIGSVDTASALGPDRNNEPGARQQLAQAPVPPRRPAHLEQHNAPVEATSEPALTPSATPPRPAIKPAAPPAARPQDIPYHPMTEPGPMGPRRAALRACTEEWQKLKKSGGAANRTWRDFSMECLSRKN